MVSLSGGVISGLQPGCGGKSTPTRLVTSAAAITNGIRRGRESETVTVRAAVRCNCGNSDGASLLQAERRTHRISPTSRNQYRREVSRRTDEYRNAPAAFMITIGPTTS